MTAWKPTTDWPEPKPVNLMEAIERTLREIEETPPRTDVVVNVSSRIAQDEKAMARLEEIAKTLAPGDYDGAILLLMDKLP